MLSIKNITDSGAAVSYFEKDDYYAGKEDGPSSEGVWWGKGAERMGLQGPVDREQFRALLEGHLPDGTELGTVRERGGEKVHTPGWDLTFSAPKSVSILAEVGGDERLLQAHDEAVRETLAWMQDNITGYRKRDWLGIRHQEGDNLAVALFQHHTSRSKDPQLHTHAVVANAVEDQDGRWRSLHSKPFYDHKMAGGNIYRAALAARVQELGYEIERTHRDGRFEITAVPADVRELFATRSQDIREAMEERGLEGPVDAARAAVMTRPGKANVRRSELVPVWEARALAAGFDAGAATDQARTAGDRTPTGPAPVERAVGEAITRLADAEAVFSNAQLLQWSLAGAMGRARIRDIEAQIGAAGDGRAVLPTKLAGVKAWTTPAAQEQERLILDSWRKSQGAVSPILERGTAAAALADSGLNEGQLAGAVAMLSSSDRYIGIEGRPGVGKTFLLSKVRPLMEHQGYTVKGMAGNSEAARLIQQESGITSSTLQKHLREASKDLVKLTKGDPVTAAEVRQRTAKEIWVIDESSQLDAKAVRRTMYLADRLGSRVVMLGDTRQLSAINAGKPFAQLLKAGMARTEIDQIVRQKDSTQLKAIREAVKGEVRAAMATLDASTRQIPNRDDRLQRIVNDWAKLGTARQNTAVLTARNQERTQLNEAMRQVLRQEKKLQGEVATTALAKVYAQRMDKVEAEVYHVGDLVRFGRGVKALDIAPGSYMRVVSADKARNELTLASTSGEGASVLWNPRSVAGGAQNGIELYRERDTSLAPGEKILWNLNSRDLKLSDGQNLANGQALTVQGHAGHELRLSNERGATITLDTRELRSRHWDHAYATTVYKSQGRTENHVLVNAEANQTELFNQKAFLVAISRQRETLSLYTDNTEAFTRNVEAKLGEKTTVQESRTETRLDAMRAKMQEVFDSWKSEPTKERDREQQAR